jgi:hypothetical protein
VLHDFRRIKKLISYFSEVKSIYYGFPNIEILYLFNFDKACKTPVSMLDGHLLAFGVGLQLKVTSLGLTRQSLVVRIGRALVAWLLASWMVLQGQVHATS